MIPPKNHAFFVSQTFTRHCNFRTSLLLLIASGVHTGSCCSRAESSAAWALHHRHHYHHLPTVRASASTFITYSSDIHHIFIRYSSIHFVLSTFRQSFQSVCRIPGLPCLCLQWRRQRPQPHFTPQCCRAAASEAKRHVAGMDMLKTSQQTGLCRCGNKAEMQSRRQSLTMMKA